VKIRNSKPVKTLAAAAAAVAVVTVQTPPAQDVFLSRHRPLAWSLGPYLRAVADSGYPYYEWNGKVYDASTFPGRDVHVCTLDDVLKTRNAVQD
jgi:hypothetical protein